MPRKSRKTAEAAEVPPTPTRRSSRAVVKPKKVAEWSDEEEEEESMPQTKRRGRQSAAPVAPAASDSDESSAVSRLDTKWHQFCYSWLKIFRMKSSQQLEEGEEEHQRPMRPQQKQRHVEGVDVLGLHWHLLPKLNKLLSHLKGAEEEGMLKQRGHCYISKLIQVICQT